MTVTIVCRNNPPADDAARADEGARSEEGARTEGSDKDKGTPAKAAKETPPARAPSASDGVCRLGQGTDLNVIGALNLGADRGNGLTEPSVNSRTSVGLRTGEPGEPPASPTGELHPETARAVEQAARVPGTSDVMVAPDQRGAIAGWSELIRTTPGLEDAARARGMRPEQLAQILGSTAWRQAIPGAPGESAVGIPTDPKQVWDLAQRAMDTHIPSLATQATAAGEIVTDNALARMTADGTPLPEAVRSFGTEVRDTANALHAFYAGTDQADRFPAFSAANGGELTQGMLNASFRSAEGYDDSMGEFAYEPQDYEYAYDSSSEVGNTFEQPMMTASLYPEQKRAQDLAERMQEAGRVPATGSAAHARLEHARRVRGDIQTNEIEQRLAVREMQNEGSTQPQRFGIRSA